MPTQVELHEVKVPWISPSREKDCVTTKRIAVLATTAANVQGIHGRVRQSI